MIPELYSLELGWQSLADYHLMELRVRAENGWVAAIYSGPVDKHGISAWFGELIRHQEDEFPFEIHDDESLSSAVMRLYDELDPDADGRAFDVLYNYRCVHDISLGNRGVETPIIIIGKRLGRLTVSKGGVSFDLESLAGVSDLGV
jgi:hypothetical protein